MMSSKADIPLAMSAYGWKAEALAHLSECLLIAESVEELLLHLDS